MSTKYHDSAQHNQVVELRIIRLMEKNKWTVTRVSRCEAIFRLKVKTIDSDIYKQVCWKINIRNI